MCAMSVCVVCQRFVSSKSAAPAPGSYNDPRTALECTRRYVRTCVCVCVCVYVVCMLREYVCMYVCILSTALCVCVYVSITVGAGLL